MATVGTLMCLAFAIMAHLYLGHGASNTTEYCTLETSGQPVLIREGFLKRLYTDDEEGSKLCFCKEGANLECTMLPDIKKKPCNYINTFYSCETTTRSRRQCNCFNGEFVCVMPPNLKGKKSAGSVLEWYNTPGVLLYMGFSKVDFNYLKNGRIKLGDEVPLNMDEEETEVRNTIQQTVNNFTSNNSKTECRISQKAHIDGNYVFQATLDEYDEYRKKKNMSDYMKWREKEECSEALDSIVLKVMTRDADIRSHIVLSMFKMAHSEANVPRPAGSWDPESRTFFSKSGPKPGHFGGNRNSAPLPSSSFPLRPHLLLILLLLHLLLPACRHI